MNDYENLKNFWNNFFDPKKVEPIKEKWIYDEKINQIWNKYIHDYTNVLDYGSGSGWALIEVYYTVSYLNGIGIDPSINGTNYANKIVEVNDIQKTKFYCGDETLLNQYPKYFDFIMSFNCLDVLPDEVIHSILKQLRASLKENGVLLIGTNPDFSRDDLVHKINMIEVGNYFYKDDILRCNKKTIDEWKRLFSEYFQVIEQFTFAITENETKNPRIGYLLKKEKNKMKALCGCDCNQCPFRPNCKGCDGINCPHGGNCIALDKIQKEGFNSFVSFKQTLVNEINDLHVKDMPMISDLNLLTSNWVNLEYPLSNGTKVKFLKDNDVVLGNQVEHLTSGVNRCFGIVATEEFILVCEYGENGIDPCIIVYKKR